MDIRHLHRAIPTTAAALLFLALAACAPQTEVIKLYDDATIADRQFERMLVIGVASDNGSRRRLEELIVDQLTSSGVTAIEGYTETGLKTTLLQDEIDDAAERFGADGILVTHIVSVDTSVNVEPGRTDVVSVCRGGEPLDYFLYDHREIREPDSVKMAHTVAAVTNLYDAENGIRLWTIQSTCFDKSSMDEVLQEEARAIVRQLRIDELVGQY